MCSLMTPQVREEVITASVLYGFLIENLCIQIKLFLAGQRVLQVYQISSTCVIVFLRIQLNMYILQLVLKECVISPEGDRKFKNAETNNEFKPPQIDLSKLVDSNRESLK